MSDLACPPPHELHSERLVVRCWHPTDAAALKDAVDSSLDHLRAYMPWAHHEPQSLEDKAKLLQSFRGRFDLGDDFVYGIFAADDDRVLGGGGLHRRGAPRTLEIGYWVRADALRQGIASEATSLLAKAAFEVCRVQRLDIVVEVSNEASCAVPRKLGFVEEGVRRRWVPPMPDGDHYRDAYAFTMLPAEYAASAMAALRVRALDSQGEQIELSSAYM